MHTQPRSVDAPCAPCAPQGEAGQHSKDDRSLRRSHPSPARWSVWSVVCGEINSGGRDFLASCPRSSSPAAVQSYGEEVPRSACVDEMGAWPWREARGTERVVDVWPVARVRVSRVVAPRIARREGWLPGCPGPTRLRAASRNVSKKLRASRSQLRDHSSLDSYHLAAPVRRDFLRFRLQFAGRVRPGPDGTGIAPGGQAEDRASGQQQRR